MEGSRALDFGEDNAGHDTDCDCKACLIDTWHAEVDELRREVQRLHDSNRGAVSLSDDERKALAWAARRGAHELRAEGWPDMKRNAEILDGILLRLEGGR